MILQNALKMIKMTSVTRMIAAAYAANGSSTFANISMRSLTTTLSTIQPANHLAQQERHTINKHR
jgi:hypothetical protein